MAYLWIIRRPPFPPLVSGDAQYAWRLIEALAQQAPVHGLALETPGQDIVPIDGVTWTLMPLNERSSIGSIASLLPNISHRFDIPAFIDKAVALAANADGVILDLGLTFLIDPLLQRLPKAGRPPIVVINHNDEKTFRQGVAKGAGNPLMRLTLAWDGWKAGRIETRANLLASGYTAITGADLAAFQARAPHTPGLLVMPGYTGPRVETRTIDASTPRRICVVGGRRSHHKRLVLNQTLAALQRAGLEKSAIIDIVGGDPDPELAARYPGFNFLGFVDDMEAYMQTVRLGLIPDEIGGGFKMRALTHVFLRVPMFALDVAVAGMDLRPGLDYVEAKNLDQLAQIAHSSLDDLNLLNRIQNTAYERCQNSFSWNERGRALHNFIKSNKNT